MKKLYWNSCSFLDTNIVDNLNPLGKIFYPLNKSNENKFSYKASIRGSNNDSIFRRTLIDCSKNDFDFAIIAWSHPERTLAQNQYALLDLNYEKLKKESQKKFLERTEKDTIFHGYIDVIPSNSDIDNMVKLEPKATDDTIFYTIALHNFFQNKGIPHLFLNMGKLDSNILEYRYDWLKLIDKKNYLSIDDNDDILKKMQFSFTEHYAKKSTKPIVKDSKIEKFKSLKGNSDEEYEIFGNGWILDVGGHLGNLAFEDLNNVIYNHIIKNNLV